MTDAGFGQRSWRRRSSGQGLGVGARVLWPSLTVALAVAVGCQAPAVRPPGGPEVAQSMAIESGALAQAEVRRLSAGASVEGRPIECLLLGEGSEVVLFVGAIHGNERAGAPLLPKRYTAWDCSGAAGGPYPIFEKRCTRAGKQSG